MSRRIPSGSTRSGAAGFTLVELMIALVLGLLVIAGAVGIFMSNRKAYASTETLGRMQETARVAFELMARDVREAGGNPCSKNIPIATTLTPTSDWYMSTITKGLVGHDGAGGSGATAKLSYSYGSSDAIDIVSGTSDDVQLVSYNPSSAELNVTGTGTFKDDDFAMICDYKQAAIFQVTQVQTSAKKLQHNPSGANCTKSFDYPVDCSKPVGSKTKIFLNGSTITHFAASRWFVANGANGPALYRCRLTSACTAVSDAEQVAEGVSDMQIKYLQDGATSYVDAQSITDWSDVTSARITLTVLAAKGTEQGKYIQGTDNAALTREITHTVMLRNRMS